MMEQLVIACVAFVGTHFLLSHPLRAALVRRMGEGPFAGLYSLVAFATLGWMVVAYRAIPEQPFAWPVGDTVWAIATAIMLVAAVLFAGSLVGNPALPGPGVDQAPVPRGVFAVTRHPMMWSFALWGVSHALVFPEAANLVLVATVITLALVGAALQDRKKRQLRPALWRDWAARTSYTPFAALAGGRLAWSAAVPRGGVMLAGLALWLAATWAHLPLAGWPAGVWRWIG